ncbi:MAG: tetratricopeptide repeat protein [Anaerolineae bacterium]|nr:tetratricopeptide repeat protein [Anaerolineae bacterium]
MTRERVAFIGREAEIQHIDDMISAWGKRRVLFIQGDGGVGKTRLLHEIPDRCADHPGIVLTVTDVLTFDDRNLHLPENLRYRLAEELGKDAFQPYCTQLIDQQRSIGPGLSREQLEQRQEKTLEAFNACLREMLSEQRGVILLDTTDALEEGDSAWEYIAADLALQPCNMLLVIAGRNTEKLYNRLQPQIGKDAQLFKLSPLTPEDSERYLLARQDQLHCTIDRELAKKIIFLAQGRPILIDLAVDWLAHELPLSWLMEESLKTIKALPLAEIEARRAEFELNLVRRVLDLRTPIDRLLLALTHAYPVNQPLAAELLGLDEEETDDLLEEVQSYISVKQLPGGWFTLHDEVRRLLEEVEQQVDPEGIRKKKDNASAAAYFENRVEALKKELQALDQQERAAEAQGQIERRNELIIRLTEIDREYWLAAGQWLHHKVRVSPEDGMTIFIQLFEEATNAYRFAVRDGFIRQLDLVRRQLTPHQQYELDIRRVKDMLDRGEYHEGKKVLLAMLDHTERFKPAQQIDMYIQLGNLEIRLGDFRAGLDNFEKAVGLSGQHALETEQMMALNALGWGNRLVGRFERAMKHYAEALELSVELGDRKREAWILNNMAFATGRQGLHKEALGLCDQALEVWKEVNFDRGLGAVHEVYGEVYVLSSDFDKALEHYRLALDVFEPANDQEWLSRVYAGCGLAYRLAGDLESAEEALQKALSINVEKDKTMILHRLGHVYLERGQIDEAERYFSQSYDLCKVVADADLELNNLSDLAEIALRRKQYRRLEEFAEKFRTYQAHWPGVNFPRACGTLLKTLGDMALCATPDDVDNAWGYYKQAFPLLAQHGQLEPYSVRVQLGNLNDLLKEQSIPIDTVKELGKRLRWLWKQQELGSSYPNALHFFLRWREGEYHA